MGRRSGFEGFLRATARAVAASEREHQRALRNQAALARHLEREARIRHNQSLRDARAAEKEARAEYLQGRQTEADDLNATVEERLSELRGILAHTLTRDDRINFNSLRSTLSFAPFQPPSELLPSGPPRKRQVGPLSWFAKLFPGATKRHALELQRANEEHEVELTEFNECEAEKKVKVAQHLAAHEKLRILREREVESRNAEVNELQAAYMAKSPDAVVAYNEMVLERSEYPDKGFDQKFRLAYVAESSELVVEYELPEPTVIPLETDYRYVKARDAIESKSRKQSEVKQIYQDVVASVTLRTLHELFEADQADALASITFTGVRDTHDPANGNEVRIAVISVRAIKSEFLAIRLDRAEKIACLKGLGAHVSSRPDELQAVKPIVEFDMVDKRFVEQGDALAMLESRPNLLEMTPTEFEVLVSNLFTRMGLDTKLTRASRDGGVDAVAFDLRPVVGGKVVIQAKRYKDTVGVSAVRDLYGTMQHEGANKGVLVCTSGYGSDAFQFSKDKPIELIDGSGLLYLLREHAGVNARIATL